MKKPLFITSVAIGISGLLTAGFYFQYWKPRKESIQKVNEVASQVVPIAKELLSLYRDRFDLMIQWQKISGEKLPEDFAQAPDLKLQTEGDFKDFDAFQMKVTNHLSSLLSHSEVRKKIKDLEKVEEKINKKRQKYHDAAIEADDLIEKFRTGQHKFPVFPAEALLHQRESK
jgi:hypothetical protein